MNNISGISYQSSSGDTLFKPSHLKELCTRFGLSPSKRYGQNYLISKDVVDKTLKAAELKKEDTVVEIGPGFGVLTFFMAQKVARVIAFEIEKKLQPYWEKKLESRPNIDIVWGNALKQFGTQSARFPEGYKVVANLPYQITSRALRIILETETKPELVVVMVQKEVAERIVAKPGDMSLLSVAIQYYGEPTIVTKVSKGNFWPEPKVDSAVVRIRTHARPGGQASFREDEQFFRIVKAGFANKRKQLWKNISTGLGVPAERIKPLLKEVAGNEKVRAEELSMEVWRRLAEQLSASSAEQEK